MSGKSGLIVGSRGTGKTTTARGLVKMVPETARLIYDVNGEYKDLYPEPFLEFDEFTDLVNRANNAFILIEESTIFLNNRGNNFDVRSALVKARHKNNTFIFVFHSLRSIPRYIFDLSDLLILHKTNDTLDQIDSRFDNPSLNEAFTQIHAAGWLKSSTGKRYSPSKIIRLN